MTRGAARVLGLILLLAGCGPSEPAGVASSALDGAKPHRRDGSVVTVRTVPDTFVWLEPTFEESFPLPEGKAYLDQQGQMFVPGEVLARAGQQVEFRSSDDVLHNVRVIRSDKTPIFNVATLPFGAYTHIFDEPGVYDVTCDIHTAMRATLFVASTPYVATSDEVGRYTFTNVVRGTYKASGFEAGRKVEKLVEVSAPQVEISIP
jgi:plastocyanin